MIKLRTILLCNYPYYIILFIALFYFLITNFFITYKSNYEEIENILEEFIRNYGKISEKTLENLILKNYSKTSVQNLLNSLDTLFSNLGIEVVDVPEYNKSIYAHIIDEQKLAENLLRVYKDKKNSIKKIENDVKTNILGMKRTNY